MSAPKLKFVNFYKLNFPLTYNPEIGTEALVSDYSHLTGFCMYVKYKILIANIIKVKFYLLNVGVCIKLHNSTYST